MEFFHLELELSGCNKVVAASYRVTVTTIHVVLYRFDRTVHAPEIKSF